LQALFRDFMREAQQPAKHCTGKINFVQSKNRELKRKMKFNRIKYEFYEDTSEQACIYQSILQSIVLSSLRLHFLHGLNLTRRFRLAILSKYGAVNEKTNFGLSNPGRLRGMRGRL
jgi:hypothetical protein